MKTAAVPEIPPLAAPGAGLPWPELQIAKLLFRTQLWGSGRKSATALIAAECGQILRLSSACDDESGARRVLIKRLPGMEDSSRYWSVFMVLEHLRVVNEFIAETIATLGRGEEPQRVASTAAVKPDPSVDGTVGGLFERSCGDIVRAAQEIPDLHTRVRHAHPWFGPLDAGAWHFLAGFHMRLHRAQIRAILRGLGLDEK